MIFVELFITFLFIGLFTFGGGYSMVALIQDAVVTQHQWLSPQEFADILAISQMTPGPIGINTATYVGYTAVAGAGYAPAAAVAGSLTASVAVLALPVALILVVGRWLLRHKERPPFDAIFRGLRLTVIGLIAAAAIGLMPAAFAAAPQERLLLALPGTDLSVTAIAVFAAVFVLSVVPRERFGRLRPLLSRLASPIALILIAGLVGIAVYGL